MIRFEDGSGISWTICKQSAPRCKQITTTSTSLLNFYRPADLPDAEPTVSKHFKVCMKSGARFTKYLTTVLRLSYDNAKVTIDLR